MLQLKATVVLLSLGILLAGCSDGGKKQLNWQYSSQLSASQKATAQKVLELFQKKCTALEHYSAAVDSAQVAYYTPAMFYRGEAHGWKGELEITLTIKQDARLPTTLNRVAGHTLQYYVGAGSMTGILAQKAEAQAFYGMPVKQGEDSMVSDNDYLIVQEF
jgi:hypothetical protein